jgi:hypothetical protein
MADLLPTFHCFDDALDYLSERVKASPRLARSLSIMLVHGIARSEDGRRYAHAWVEESGKCWDAALYEGQRIWYSVPREEYYAARDIQATTRYTIRQAARLNLRSGHYGPWEPRYRALCGGSDQIMGRIEADATGARAIGWEDER